MPDLIRVPIDSLESDWKTEIDANALAVDSLIGSQTIRVWQQSTSFIIGDRVFDQATMLWYECITAHVSASSGTFSAARIASPNLWKVARFGEEVSRQLKIVRFEHELDPESNGDPVDIIDLFSEEYEWYSIVIRITGKVASTLTDNIITVAPLFYDSSSELYSAGISQEYLRYYDIASDTEVVQRTPPGVFAFENQVFGANPDTDDFVSVFNLDLVGKFAEGEQVQKAKVKIVPSILAAVAGGRSMIGYYAIVGGGGTKSLVGLRFQLGRIATPTGNFPIGISGHMIKAEV